MDDHSIQKAKQAAARPLGEKMAKFPLLFSKALIFGQRPSRDRPTEIRNGTATLANLGAGPIAITCQHVIACYRRQREQVDNMVFQIGDVDLDPLQQLIDENARLDLAVIRLTEPQIRAITAEGEIGSCVFQPKSWPSPPQKTGEFIAFGGFPGKLKSAVSFEDLEFGSWSSGASEISSVSEYQFVSAFDRSYWVTSFGGERHMELTALGGMSGGPAFTNRGLYWDFVGIVSEYNEKYDAVFFSSTRQIRADGTIEPPAV